MPYFMVQACYSKSSYKSMMNNPHDRREVIKRAVETAGGKLHALYFSLGEFDVLTIQEWPDAESAAAFAVAVGSSDAVTRTMTTQLFTSEQGMNVMGAAQKIKYNPPK